MHSSHQQTEFGINLEMSFMVMKVQGLLTTECGANSTSTHTHRLIHNMFSVVLKIVTMQFAMDGTTMKSTHMCIKSYYVYDQTGAMIQQSNQL